MIKLLENKNRTASEELFNELCNNKGIDGEEIPESTEKGIKMPDVEIILNGLKIIVEIKGLEGDDKKNKKLDKIVTDQLKEIKTKQWNGQQIEYRQSNILRQPAAIKSAFHNRLKQANKQLKTDEYIKHPAIFIIYNDINKKDNYKTLNDFNTPIHPSNINNLMYNITTICPKFIEGNLHITDSVFKQLNMYCSLGKNAKFTPNKHTQISAVGLLSKRTYQDVPEMMEFNNGETKWNDIIKLLNYKHKHNEIKLQIFHNIFAKNPIDIKSLKKIAYEQYKDTFDPNNKTVPRYLKRVDI